MYVNVMLLFGGFEVVYCILLYLIGSSLVLHFFCVLGRC